MFEIKGKYANALITTDNVESEAIKQITKLVNNVASEGSKIVIMPDVHSGKGSVIGTTMTIVDRVVPNLVGVDIGCGVLAVEIVRPNQYEIDFKSLDQVIRNEIPHGFNVNSFCNTKADEIVKDLIMPMTKEELTYISMSLGTLGGGNHFISVESDGGSDFLCVHTGSRGLGYKMAKFYQEKAISAHSRKGVYEIISKLKAEGREVEIEKTLKDHKKNEELFDKELAFLSGQDMKEYLHDIKIAQRFAEENRNQIVNTIFRNMGWSKGTFVSSVHNYIDTETMILRKGAVEACAYGGLFLIPLNMKDGTLICRGAYNPEWNQSAPHGAGRTMSRRFAKENLSFDDFEKGMSGIWTTSVNQSTLDEAPSAYKPVEEIKEIVSKKYPIVFHLKTKYNFKSSDKTE